MSTSIVSICTIIRSSFTPAELAICTGCTHPRAISLWSAPPRERQLMYIMEDTVRTNDVLYPRCSGFLFEYHYGLPVHTNCHDMQAEAQREYGLTPDDVHDSFNFFMHTGIDRQGRPYIARQTSKKGDFVELLALIDVLAVPNVCGADIMATSDFSAKPIGITILQGSDADFATVPVWPKYRNQRSPADFKIKAIKSDRELRRDPSYVPEFTNVPIRTTEVPVKLDAQEAAMLEDLQKQATTERRPRRSCVTFCSAGGSSASCTGRSILRILKHKTAQSLMPRARGGRERPTNSASAKIVTTYGAMTRN